MYNAGFKTIENIDISPEIVRLMSARYPSSAYPGMSFEVRDFLASSSAGGGAPLPLHRFGAVVDKAGIWDWLQDERPSALPRLLVAVRDALREKTRDEDGGDAEPGMYIITTKQTPKRLQRTLTVAGTEGEQGGLGGSARFVVDATVRLTGGIAWAYILIPA